MKADYKGKALGFLAGAGMLVSQAADAGDTGMNWMESFDVWAGKNPEICGALLFAMLLLVVVSHVRGRYVD